jgi:hypothetical protein
MATIVVLYINSWPPRRITFDIPLLYHQHLVVAEKYPSEKDENNGSKLQSST